MARAVTLGASFEEAFSSDSLFFALHLAWETEEDCDCGRREIVAFTVGQDPRQNRQFMASSSPRELSEAIRRFRRSTEMFERGRMSFWRSIKCRTFVPADSVRGLGDSLPFHPFLFRRRTESQRLAISEAEL